MNNRIISAAAALLAAAMLTGGAVAPAMAKSDPTKRAPQEQRDNAKESAEPLYCVVETPTGTHIRTKDCRTRADWIAATGVDPAKVARK